MGTAESADQSGAMARTEVLQLYAKSDEFSAAASLVAEHRHSELGGFVGASLAFFLSAWKATSGNAVTLLVLPNQDEADQLFDELEALASDPVVFFPPWESLFLPDSELDGETYSQRVGALQRLVKKSPEPCFIVAPVQAILQPVPTPKALRDATFNLRKGDEVDPTELAENLARNGFRNVSLVEKRGEFSQRGDVFDFYPYQGSHPVRLEFFGDTLESLREFDTETQRSVQDSEKTELSLILLQRDEVFCDCFRGKEALITDYLDDEGVVVLKEPDALRERAGRVFHNVLEGREDETLDALFRRVDERRQIRAHRLPVSPGEERLNVSFGSVERFKFPVLADVCGQISAHLESGGRVVVFCDSAAEKERFWEILSDHNLGRHDRLVTAVGALVNGFEVLSLQTALLTTRELFNRRLVRRTRKPTQPSRAIDSFVELSRGDYVVHVVHGIARYLGMDRFRKDGVEQEFLALEFRASVKVYVPVSKIDLIQKYIGSGDRPPVLDKVGGTSWAKKKEAVEDALMDLASDLLDVQALRQERHGIQYPADSEWQREFEASFHYEDTPDQLLTTDDIKEDMQSTRPMDRLICGDVGYGKTELAMRAAFKAVEGGKQVAILVPTTVLAQQHFRTITERTAGFPITVDVISRFRSTAEQKTVLRRAAEGKIDILVGTHRLLSEDVVFRDLGLVIIDEEQRFGVTHKERFKKLRATVDVLTLTATPIPRTLHMSLLGMRDISSLRTPPQGRAAIRTDVIRFEPKTIREIILRELNRDGQIFFVHNRIYDIKDVRFKLQQVVPEARIAVAHGRMKEDEIEEVMVGFIAGDYDLLISTTIIENGIDIRSVNTIFIDEADRYGLSEMHQLRGRVGRYKHQAYCYLVLPEHRHVSPEAEKRLQALVEFSDLGAGFQIAMRDLEIRGAGNILGPEQSGHIAAVGYDMYCRLLEKAVRQLKKEDYAEPVHVEVELAVQAFVPEDYVVGESPKLDIYRRVSQARENAELEELGAELADRYGELPPPAATLLDIQRLRVMCAARGVETIGQEEQNIVLKGRETMKNLLENCPLRVTVLDTRTVAVSLKSGLRKGARVISDDEVFHLAIAWMESGKFPLKQLRAYGRSSVAETSKS